MSQVNTLEREQVCLCPKQLVGQGWFEGVWRDGKLVKPDHHKDDCPFFEDYSDGLEADSDGEYVW